MRLAMVGWETPTAAEERDAAGEHEGPDLRHAEVRDPRRAWHPDLGVHDGIMFAGFMTLYFFYHWMISRALTKNRLFNRQLQPQISQ